MAPTMIRIELKNGINFTLDAAMSGVSREKGTVTDAEGRVIAIFSQGEFLAAVDQSSVIEEAKPKSLRRPLGESQRQADIGDR